MESKTIRKACTIGSAVMIVVITLLAGFWLWRMTEVLKPQSSQIEVRHVYANFATKSDKGEDTQYTLYKQAEEALRAQMNTWLTLVGFFGVLLGLVVPLAGYLLQQHSLSEERERIKEELKKQVEDAAKDAAKEAADKAAKEAVDSVKAEMQKQIDDIRAEVKKVDGLYDKIEETRGMVEADRKVIEQLSPKVQRATEDLEAVKSEATKASQAVQSLSEVISRDERSGKDLSTGGDEKKSVTSELEALRKKAEAGDMKAQNGLGWRYRFGKKGAEKDGFEAVYWYRKAANQGYAPAQYNLGLAYDFGRGVDKNKTKAVYWYRKAAEQEHAGAENNLGVKLECGWGCERNEQEAWKLYQRAMEHGDAMGRVNVAETYEFGKFGVKQDLTKAKELYQQVVDDPNASEEAKKIAQEGLDRIARGTV